MSPRGTPFVLTCLVAAVLLLGACSTLIQRPDPPNVTLSDLGVLDATLFEQRYRLRLRVQNPNDFALEVRGMRFEVELNDRDFAHGVHREPFAVPAYGEALVEVVVVSNLARVWDQLRAARGRGDAGRFSYGLHGSLDLAGSPLRLPFDYDGEIDLGPAMLGRF